MHKKVFRGQRILRIGVALPPIHYYPSRKEWEAACWEKISQNQDILHRITTAHERRDLVMRAATMDRLSRGKSYREIGRELWLSPQTVSGIKKALSEKIYASYLERSKKERKKKVYSSPPTIHKSKPSGMPRRTKYGTVYIPL